MSEQILKQVLSLLQENRKAEATSLLFEHVGSLSSAKEKIDELMQNIDKISIKEEQKNLHSNTQDLEIQVSALLAQNKKIEAIKLVKEITHWGLKEAKDWVENFAANHTQTLHDNSEPLTEKVLILLAQNKKIEAIKLVKEITHWGLKEAKDWVDNLETGKLTPLAILGNDTTVNLEALQSKVLVLLAKGKKLEAIKLVKNSTTLGLKEAKDWVESLE